MTRLLLMVLVITVIDFNQRGAPSLTIHQHISAADRTLLPRGLIQRQTANVASYEFKFEIGERLMLLATNELCVIIGRKQTVDCQDEYIVELAHVDAAPLWVLEHQIARVALRRRRRVYHARWKFEIGSRVMMGDTSAIVISRQCSAFGRQIYKIAVTAKAEGRPFRYVLASGLEPIAG
ncbi:hypothetical protein PY650_30915 [Rhizobium calliandrae]|uniref:Uncharacterized protein n=1 Tax=Rhizobium calliandrae TaxID=1312182 RepID=A0ABT7KMT1_9HYPH|nr:hypothetical protein [Rhizobium calliandrae]MDL2409951.1 hypothetical protein [Rhizobium calliandrae]